MPQASDADRARYRERFPDIGAEHGIKALTASGFTLTKDWCWIPPAGHTPTESQLFVIGFLCDEWDFGGLVEPTEEAAPRKEGKP